METIANRIITSLADLEAMDRLQTGIEDKRYAAIDLRSAVIYEEDTGFPDGERLVAELVSGKRITVATHKVLEYVLLRHAEAQAVRDRGNVRKEYEHIRDHFMRKTGFEF